jgi:hypothetical protein
VIESDSPYEITPGDRSRGTKPGSVPHPCSVRSYCSVEERDDGGCGPRQEHGMVRYRLLICYDLDVVCLPRFRSWKFGPQCGSTGTGVGPLRGGT